MTAPIDFIIIDDEDVNNLICQYQIARVYDQAEVITFVDPYQGLAYLKELIKKPIRNKTVLYLDINMPGLSGWELISELEASSRIPVDMLSIYMLSSSINPFDPQMSKDNPNVAGFISKPLSIEILQSIQTSN